MNDPMDRLGFFTAPKAGGLGSMPGWLGLSRRRWLQVASVVTVLLVWQIVGMNTNPILFATPVLTAAAFVDLIQSGMMLKVFPQSMADLFTGFALAAVVGITIGALIGRSATLEAILDPYINFAMATPLIAVVPLLVVWFGYGFTARVTVVFTLAVFKIIVNTAAGMHTTPRVLREMARTYHLSEVQVVRDVMLLNAVPSIFAGLRLGLSSALIGMIIGELEMAVTGLGGMIYDYGNQLRMAYVLAGVCTASIVGVIALGILAVAQSRGFPWVAATTVGEHGG
jgi:ABC-type nitrate/sulfonate/bicarbonate transport system, permease component